VRQAGSEKSWEAAVDQRDLTLYSVCCFSLQNSGRQSEFLPTDRCFQHNISQSFPALSRITTDSLYETKIKTTQEISKIASILLPPITPFFVKSFL